LVVSFPFLLVLPSRGSKNRLLKAYGHAVNTIKMWAEQFERMSRTAPEKALPDSS
jgi:hypothetical protein